MDIYGLLKHVEIHARNSFLFVFNHVNPIEVRILFCKEEHKKLQTILK